MEEEAVASDNEEIDDEEKVAYSDGDDVIEDENMCDGLETDVADAKLSAAIVALIGALSENTDSHALSGCARARA